MVQTAAKMRQSFFALLPRKHQHHSEWTNVRVETVNKNATILVNSPLAFPHEATGVVDKQYRFKGVGAVKDTW